MALLLFRIPFKNGKFDVKPWWGQADEPFGCYKRMKIETSMPDWGSIKFDLDENITGIEIDM